MNEKTKKLCYHASKLYESQRISANTIYDLLVYSNSRVKEVAQARQLVGYVLYNNTKTNLQSVAEELNITNHSTVIHWLDKISVDLRTNRRMQYRVQYLTDIFKGNPRELIRNSFNKTSKHHLTNAEMQFIVDNYENIKDICYYADFLGKNRLSIKRYISKIEQLNKAR